MKLEHIETPALILDKKILDKNRAAMKALLEGCKMKLRPHYKSHKCTYLAHMQIEDGAKGMTCAKLSEAKDLADSGIEDILIANQITDPGKIRQLADLARVCKLTVCVDDTDNVRALGEAVYCLIEYEIGMNRCGVTTKEEVLALCKAISEEENLCYEGIQAYAGHISHMEDTAERLELTTANYEKVKSLVDYLSDNGFETKTISGGSTGTAQIKAKQGLYTELQAGSYLFMDSTYHLLDVPFENSLFVLTSVVSKRDGLTVVDAGVKTCGVDQGMPKIVGNRAKEIVASEEHFQLHHLEKNMEKGEKLLLIPGHCCSTINLHDRIYLVEDGKVLDRIMITGRGYGK